MFLELQEGVYKYKLYTKSAGVPNEDHDEDVASVTEAMSQYSEEVSSRAFSAFSISGVSPSQDRIL